MTQMNQLHLRVRASTLLTVLASLVSLLLLAGCGNPTAPISKITTSEGLADINNTKLFYKIIGQGKPVFVLHGGPGISHLILRPHMEELAKDYQLIFYDQRGAGFSDGQLEQTAISVDQFVEDLEALRNAFQLDKISVIGHSWGAVLAMHYALKYREHLDALILVDSPVIQDGFERQIQETIDQRLRPEDKQTIDSAYARAQAENTPEALAAYLKLWDPVNFFDTSKAAKVDTTVPANMAKNFFAIQALIGPSMKKANTDIDTKLSSLRVPTLIIHGDSDWIPVASSQHIHDLITGSSITIIKKSGHFPFIEQPAAFFTAVREFMQRLSK